ncbi:MAG: hypothetical protein M3R13_00655 [Armatimonadota bacterium]|nr:hypothetical protein [Armatimonadota bacterium]
MVLAPISNQGTTIIDDGKQRVHYEPDEKKLTIQDSPLRSVQTNDAERRFRLLSRNYKVKSEGNETVASRKSLKVLLTPHAKEKGYSRRYWIDTETAVLLRVEWVDPSGKKQTMSNTISISYPKSLPESTFDKTFVGQPREIHIRAPARQNDFVKLAGSVGFGPINPHDMPYGFLFIGADAIRDRNRSMAALRYTDGAANITIYQAKTSAGHPPWRSNSGMESAKVDDVWLTVDGDIPKVGKQAILGALKKSGATRSSQLQTRAARMFNGTEDTIEKLRATGLDFEDVVACLVAGGGSAAKTMRAGRSVLDGESFAQIARAAKVDSKKIREGIERFWDLRQE